MIIMYSSFAVVLVALVLYIALRRSDRIQYGLPEIPDVAASEIDTIEVRTEGGEDLRLRREGSSWAIEPEGYRADKEAVEAMLEAFSNLTVTDLISTSGYYEKYELDTANKLTVSASGDGEVLLTFDLGKRAPSYNHTYISFDDGNVYHAATDLRRVFEKEPDGMRDQQVMAFAKEEIVRIDAVRPESQVSLTKEATMVGSDDASKPQTVTWMSSRGDVWETEVVDEFLSRLDDLTATEFAETPSPQDVEPLIAITLHGQEEHTLQLLAEEEEGYLARSSYTPYEFYISSWQGENILETFSLGEAAE